MDLQQEKEERFNGFLTMSGKVFFIVLAAFALVALPYRLDHQKGSYVSSVALAEDGGGDSGDHDGSSDSDGDHDGDHDSDGSDHDIGDDHDDHDDGDMNDNDDGDMDDHDAGDMDDHDDGAYDDSHEAEHEGDAQVGAQDDSNESYKGSNSIGGIKGLAPVSPKEEAELVGNWGDSSNK